MGVEASLASFLTSLTLFGLSLGLLYLHRLRKTDPVQSLQNAYPPRQIISDPSGPSVTQLFVHPIKVHPHWKSISML
ncbi:hypothetical protein SISSUDRAFT_697 [Sistotremastrum suecicum HHB10207 ss-3]|uniref:Uncharacterized protein n=1 Tax=Sistotremastrum suecicum HHB10207 ss-3 TaxID=1314776 RepID=A0A166J1J9_9AGAM|nr:hypothetical protein SISSUDRAFT_697 [Sistotremastrum suecicum HHB10207 ss-3]